ncbi:MAG: hypothetical protein AB8B80_11515 [Marinicellaceae bacterium]
MAQETFEDELGIEFEVETETDELGIEFEEEDSMIQTQPKNIHYKFRGFIDTRWGNRIQNSDDFQNQKSLFETRLQGSLRFNLQNFKFNIKADLVHDDIIEGTSIDVREAYLELPSNDIVQTRIGRQSILWGLGDLMVVNDLFPKDYLGLYYGRDAEAEYVVNTSDAIRSSFFIKDSTLDIVLSEFKPSDVPTGVRFSYFNPFSQEIVGEDQVLNIKDNNKAALMSRWNTSIFDNEVAFYYNKTFWQTPEGFNPNTQEFFYPKLETIGASIRNEIGKGILSLDAAYYFSKDDSSGDKFSVRNSEVRFILAYDFEVKKNLNLGLQWYQEQRQDQNNYMNNLPKGFEAENREYNLMTMRLTQFLMNQKMTLSLFSYYSPTQDDGYLRLNMFHKFDDHWMINIGSNHFSGKANTRFGQLKDNSNYFAAIRWSF